MNKFWGAVYCFCLAFFGLLCYLARQSQNLPGDTTIRLWLQSIDLPFFNTIMQAVSYIASVIPATVIVILVGSGLWANGKKLEAIFTVSLPSVAALLGWLLKMLISRPRPETALILQVNNDYSFPSGHITYAVVFYGFIFYLVPRLTRQPAMVWVLRSVLTLLILLTAASRVYLGAHWPSDILGSLLLGGLLLAPAIVLYENYAKGKQIKLAQKNA